MSIASSFLFNQSPWAIDLCGELIDRIRRKLVLYKVMGTEKSKLVGQGLNRWRSAGHRREPDDLSNLAINSLNRIFHLLNLNVVVQWRKLNLTHLSQYIYKGNFFNKTEQNFYKCIVKYFDIKSRRRVQATIVPPFLTRPSRVG